MAVVTQTAPLGLSDNEKSHIANVIASTLVENRVSPTVFHQPLSFLRTEQDAGAFFDFLDALPYSPLVRSRKEREDYRAFAQLCHRFLDSLDTDDVLFILGWARSLYGFYRDSAAITFLESLSRIETLDGMLLITQDLSDFSRMFAYGESSLDSDTAVEFLQNLQRLSGYLSEQKRVQGVSDRLPYLAEASNILIETSALLDSAPTNPDIEVLRETILQWNEIVQVELTGLRRSANPILSLVTNRIPTQKQVTIVVDLVNEGEGLARNVRVTIREALGYSLGRWSPTRVVDPLPAGASRRLEFTIQPQAATAVAQFEIRFDDLTGTNKQRQFSDEIHFTPVVAGFRRIEINPYVAGVPVDPDAHAPFVGRADLINWIEEQLSGFQKAVLVLYGQRRTGKTSVLFQLERGPLGKRLRERKRKPVYPVYVDLQGLTDTGTDLFLLGIAETIVRTLARRQMSMPSPSREVFGRAPFRAFNRFLDAAELMIADSLVVLMLDEFEALEERVNDRKVDPDIFAQFRSQMQHRKSLTFILAGTHRLEEMSGDYQSIIFNVARHREVTFLTKEEATDLICSPVEPIVQYDPLAVDSIWRATHGHPYFIQLLCHDIIDEMNRRAERNYVILTDVARVREKLISGSGLELAWLWNQSSSIEQRILAILATVVDSGRSYITATELLEYFREARVPPSKIDRALDRLVSRRVLQVPLARSASPGELAYTYCFDLFREWVFRRHRVQIGSTSLWR